MIILILFLVSTDIDVPLNSLRWRYFVFKGGTDVDFSITDGTDEKLKIDTATGDLTVVVT